MGKNQIPNTRSGSADYKSQIFRKTRRHKDKFERFYPEIRVQNNASLVMLSF